MIAAGKLRHRVTLQQFETTKDSYGGDIKTWSDYHTCWGAVEPLSGREYFMSQQTVPEVDTRVTIRYRSGIAPTMRVQWSGRNYDIKGIIDTEERHRRLELMCTYNPTS